jgi:hypothetical protein
MNEQRQPAPGASTNASAREVIEPRRVAGTPLAFAWTDLIAILLCVSFLTGWAWTATQSRSLAFPAVFAACGLVWYLAGSVAARFGYPDARLRGSVAVRLVVGFLIVNTSLFLLLLLSPLSVGAHFALLLLAALAAFLAMRPRLDRGRTKGEVPSLLAVALSLLAATLLAQDSIRPTEALGDFTAFKPWVDGFFHAAQIRSLGNAHDTGFIENARLASVPAAFYHYASYMTPVLARDLAPLPAYAAFSGLLVPLGVFLTGLAAFALVSSWWGSWPGLLGCASVLLIPDASHHGMANSFLGYHWMQLVGPAGTYGVATLAIAWVLVCRGCAEGRPLKVAGGWITAAVSIGYKAQFFVAGAFPLWIYPALFFRGLTLRRRWTLLVLQSVAFAGAVAISARLPRVPRLQLDFSSTREFLQLVVGLADPGPIRSFFASRVGTASHVELLALGSVYLTLCTLGVFAVAWSLLAVWLRRRMSRSVGLLPPLLLANFLLMALGLALDDRGIGSREELLHRPFVWVYFFTAAWVGGAAGLAAFGAEPRLRPRTTAALGAVLAVLLLVPAFLGRGAHRQPGIGLADLAFPTGLVTTAEYLRLHAAPQELVQDSHYDPSLALTGLSERRPYVVAYMFPISEEKAETRRRVALVEAFKRLLGAREIADAARQLGLRWFVLHPGDVVSWPASVTDRPAFSSGGFRAYRFDW